MPGPLSTVPVKKPLHLMSVKTQLVLGCKKPTNFEHTHVHTVLTLKTLWIDACCTNSANTVR